MNSSDFPGNRNTPELQEVVKEIFPLEPQDYEIKEVEGSLSKWRSSIRCSLKEEDVEAFIRMYETKNAETLHLHLNKAKNLSSRSQLVFNGYYHCHHQTRNPATKDRQQRMMANPTKRSKNTNCPFVMNIKVNIFFCSFLV